MNCKSNSSENLERRLGGEVAYIYELPASEGDVQRYKLEYIIENLK